MWWFSNAILDLVNRYFHVFIVVVVVDGMKVGDVDGFFIEVTGVWRARMIRVFRELADVVV